MKLFRTLFLALVSLFCIDAYSQSLVNTTWQVFDTAGTPLGSVKFIQDTILIQRSNTPFFPMSTYQENNNNFVVVDLNGSACSTADTGAYTFSMTNDTLNFTTIVDSCASRAQTFEQYDWVRILTGLYETPNNKIKLYPNPTDRFVNISLAEGFHNGPFFIFNTVGERVISGTMNGKLNEVDLSGLPNGIYFLSYQDNTAKIVKY